jgi:hypothetical protein
MGRIIIGLLMLAAGAGMAIKANWLYSQFGSISFAEKYLGTSGGTRLFYKLLGTLIVFVGFLVVTNLHGEFFSWILSPLIRVSGGGAGGTD